MLSDEDENPYIDKPVDIYEEKAPPPPGTTGLALAEHYFGPLLSPVAATPAQWAAYTEHRRGANAKYRNVFDRPERAISEAVAGIESELGLDAGRLQQCVSILGRLAEWDSEVSPRDADVLVRIYAPAAPKYVDVHLTYHCRSRMHSIEWAYSLGYRIYHRIAGPPTAHDDPSTDGPVSTWHARGGWQSICWGYYDDEDNYGRRWRRIEVADMGLHAEGVREVHEALFGPIETPPGDGAEALLAHRRMLVATVRFLLAALGITYEVACTDSEDEWDARPRDFMLEGLSDKWVARGIRAACGFQLAVDAEAARRGAKERVDLARGVDEARYDEDEDEDEDDYSDDGYGSW